MTSIRKTFASLMLCGLLAMGLLPGVALAVDESEGSGVNSFRFRDGERVAEETIEEDDELALTAAAGYTMWTRNENGVYVSSNGKEIPGALRRGIDVSEWNGTIDWAKVKKDDVSFAILRCGGTYMSSRKQYSDDTFVYNAKECERLGIPYGVYFFSTAKSAADAKKELDFTLQQLKGLNPSMPIYYDLEWEDLASASNRKLLADISTIFCEGIAAAGYEPGVYASVSWWEYLLTDPCFDRWTKWVAQYYSECEYQGGYDIWQCTSVATINGIPGSNNVDLNFDFRSDWGARGGWEKSGSNWKYRYQDGSYASGSLVRIEGAVYTFDKNNNALTGWQTISGSTYYFDPTSRAMQTGWLWLNGSWYLLDASSGSRVTGWRLVDGDWYFFGSNGVMKEGEVFSDGGSSYIARESGVCPSKAWVLLKGKWYLTDSSCALRKGWVTDGGVKYYLDPSSFAMKCSESFVVDGVTYTANASGAVSNQEGWAQSGGRWRYCLADGSFVKNQFKTIEGATYWFDASGWMVTGWRQISGKWYCFDGSGAMRRNAWEGNYYLGSDGAMLVSCKTPDGYYVDASGAWVGYAGWRNVNGAWWYMYENGSWPASKFEKIDGVTYWFDASGWMATGWRKISNKWYYFDGSGAMASSRWIGDYYLGADGAMLVSTTTPDGYKVDANGAWVR